MSETISAIVAAHREGTTTPADTVARTFGRIRDYDDPATFITLREETDVVAEAQALSKSGASHLPLFGVPVAVKDNIDVAGLPTTAACPAFAYMPREDATVVRRLKDAGAIVIGKTNLDQFATGLVGVRSPYGIPRNSMRSDLVPGGSSSGSAVAVGAGLVPLALGTDTAGSGRIPAMLNNIVGLKPSLGLLSASGVLPACRTLDTVSIFTFTVDDAMTALEAIAGFDAADPYSKRRSIGPVGSFPAGVRVGIPRKSQLQFFGDDEASASYALALERLKKLGAVLVEFDIEPFYELASLLYNGPWVAERYFVIRDLLKKSPNAVHPITREITMKGTTIDAADTFGAFYRLEAMRRVGERAFAAFDVMAVPTAPSAYTVDEVLKNPVELNSRNGTYTNFVNLLDMCGLAVPSSIRDDGIPFGITLLAPAGEDALLASIGRSFHKDAGLTLGALGVAAPELQSLPEVAKKDEITVAVVGAHLTGMPLNRELRALNARFLEATATDKSYKLYALKGTTPLKPGLMRIDNGAGSSIELELWALSAAAFGAFVAAIQPPLSIGTIRLSDNREVKGFLVEPTGLAGAEDISSFGGWRAYLAARN